MSRTHPDRIRADLPAAMKARDSSRVAVLRTTLAALANAEAVDPSNPTARTGLLGDVARIELTDDDVRDIICRERDELRASERELSALGQSDAAAELAARAAVLDAYL